MGRVGSAFIMSPFGGKGDRIGRERVSRREKTTIAEGKNCRCDRVFAGYLGSLWGFATCYHEKAAKTVVPAALYYIITLLLFHYNDAGSGETDLFFRPGDGIDLCL
jgi:hypothetical protein